MKKTIQTKENENGEMYFDINELEDFIDTKKAAYYKMTIKNGTIILKFYDKKRKLLKCKGNN